MQFETLYDELAHGPEIVRALVSGITQAEARIKPAPDSWSVLEVVCHLCDEERDDFAAERARSLAWLRGLSSPDWEAEYVTPFRRMKVGDMLSAWVAHDNLHMRQLVELRRGRAVRLAEPYDVGYAGDW